MDAAENSVNKRLYKLTIEALKVIPMLLALCELLNTVIGYFDIDSSLLSFLGGISLFPLLFLYLISYVFRFCIYHRMFLHYILCTNIINIFDYYIGVPVSDRGMLAIYLSVACVFLFLILYYHQKEKCSRQ